jgi:hypothetical protein
MSGRTEPWPRVAGFFTLYRKWSTTGAGKPENHCGGISDWGWLGAAYGPRVRELAAELAEHFVRDRDRGRPCRISR